jgi:hypothetical protein
LLVVAVAALAAAVVQAEFSTTLHLLSRQVVIIWSLLAVAVLEVLQARLVEMDPVRASTALLRMAVAVAVHVKQLGGLVLLVVVAVKTVPMHPVPHPREIEVETVCQRRLALQLAAVVVQVVQDCRGSPNAALKFLGEEMAESALPTQSPVRRRITAVVVAADRTITPVQLLILDKVAMAAAGTAQMEIN